MEEVVNQKRASATHRVGVVGALDAVVRVVGDMIIVNGTYLLASALRFWRVPSQGSWEAYLAIAPWVTVASLVLFRVYGLYTPPKSHWEEMFASLIASVAVLLLFALSLSYIMNQFAFPRSVLLIASALQLLLLGLLRRLAWSRPLRQTGPLRLAMVGSLSQVQERALRDGGHVYQVVGMNGDVSSATRSGASEEFPLWGPFSEMAAAVDHEGVSGVLLGADVSREVKVTLVSVAAERGLPVYVVPGIYEIMLCQSRLEQLSGFPVLRLMSTASRSSAAWKRLSDLVLVLICAGPATLLILLSAIALRLESPRGDIFYRQQRVGQGGKVFDIVKLRTMVPEAEMATGPILATERDPRITRVGRVLRAARIDELPQLWNVLKGDMSFVGPRPERPIFVDQFRKEIPLYDCRHQVKGGITGLAQVEGQYSTSAEDKLQYDLLYTKTQSLIKDLHILLNTLKVMLMRSKSM